MATIYKEFIVEADAEKVWDALRDFGAVHTRLAPGFLTDAKLDGQGARIVSFANGMVARELLVGIDEPNRRLAYTITGGKASHHHASAQVFAHGVDYRRVARRICGLRRADDGPGRRCDEEDARKVEPAAGLEIFERQAHVVLSQRGGSGVRVH